MERLVPPLPSICLNYVEVEYIRVLCRLLTVMVLILFVVWILQSGTSKKDLPEISYVSTLSFSLLYWDKLCIRIDILFSNATRYVPQAFECVCEREREIQIVRYLCTVVLIVRLLLFAVW